MIYGEERETIPFSKGLWLTDDLDAVPDGFAANLVNLSPNAMGSLEIRPNYIPVSNFSNPTFTLANLTSFNPLYLVGNLAEFSSRSSYNWSAHDLQAISSTDPTLVVCRYESGSLSVYTLTLDGTYYATIGLAGGFGVPHA